MAYKCRCDVPLLDFKRTLKTERGASRYVELLYLGGADKLPLEVRGKRCPECGRETVTDYQFKGGKDGRATPVK